MGGGEAVQAQTETREDGERQREMKPKCAGKRETRTQRQRDDTEPFGAQSAKNMLEEIQI